MHDLCNMHALDQFAFVYLDFVIEAAIMEQYKNKVGLAALEWCDVFDPESRCTTWIADEEWFTDVTSRQMDFPVSMIEGRTSSPCLDCMGW